MPKSISGTPLYEIKATNPNALANFDPGKLTKAIGDNMNKVVGKPMQGLVVKANDAKAIVEKVKKDVVAAKVKEPWLRAGLSGTDVIFLVTDAKGGSYEQTCVLVPGYTALCEKLKKEAALVVNLDKGDRVIDQAAKDMARNNNTRATTPDKAEFGISGSAPIILLAHGDEDKTSTGQIYGKDFAGKSPADIVKLLTENPDAKKRLSPDYAGTIYLDGCFTAQGGAMQNYTKQVWELLKAKGYKKAMVKGNLGLAATTKSGDEIITTSEADEQAKKITKTAEADFQKAIAGQQGKLDAIWKAKYQKTRDQKGFEADPEVVKLQAEVEGIRKRASAKLQEDLKKIPGYRVTNLVGNFGLKRLN